MKYGLIGASGKMGKEIESLFSESGHELVFKYDDQGSEFTDSPELIVDFSLPDACDSSIAFVRKYKVPLIIGTTGLSPNQMAEIKELSMEVPVVQSFNFSVGIQMLLKCAEILNDNLSGWDVEISETHHRFKKDKPSGTALMIKDHLKKEINISSQRLGNITGDHTISFGSLGEVISITHRATSRRTFAIGVLKSAEFIMNKKNGYYTFQDVLFNA